MHRINAHRSRALGISVLGVGFSLANAGYAQDAPAGLAGQDPASTGVTEVATGGFQQADSPPESTDATELSASAGGVFTSGNSRSRSITGSGSFLLRRGPSQWSAIAAANYGQAAASRQSDLETVVKNYQARLRNDYFLSEDFALFIATSGRHDPFQGLKMRLNVDPGVAYHFFKEPRQHFWGELGYDFQYDARRQSAINEVFRETGLRLPNTQVRHHGRAFIGYDNKVNSAVTLSTGIEYLQAFVPFRDEDTNEVNWRLNWDAGVTARVADKFSIATTVSVKYDNNPLPELSRTDTVTGVSLVYSMF